MSILCRFKIIVQLLRVMVIVVGGGCGGGMSLVVCFFKLHVLTFCCSVLRGEVVVRMSQCFDANARLLSTVSCPVVNT